MGDSWAGAGEAEVKDKTAVVGAGFIPRLPVCTPWPFWAPPGRCLWADLQWVLHKELQAGGRAPGSQLQPTDWRFDSLSLDTLTGITSAIICQSLFIFQRHGQYLLVLRFSSHSSTVYHARGTLVRAAS